MKVSTCTVLFKVTKFYTIIKHNPSSQHNHKKTEMEPKLKNKPTTSSKLIVNISAIRRS